MSCCGQHKAARAVGAVDKPLRVKPDTECALCGDKHLSTAFVLWSEGLAGGYTLENRAAVVGELCASAWHIWRADYALAQLIRDIRHQMQRRQEASIEWGAALGRMAVLVEKELEANK